MTTADVTTATARTHVLDHAPIAARLRTIVTELSAQFYERNDVIRALMVTVLAGQHALVIGPPGTAKSDLARELTARFQAARYWEVLLGKFTSPTKLFGPIDVAALLRGEYTQIFDRRATTADIAFIDEIFKCGDGALNEMLAFLNERIYHPENGGDPIRCPLITAITASNELPSGEELDAFFDRLLVRIEVGYLVDPANFAQLMRDATVSPTRPTPTTVDLLDLRTAVELGVPAVSLPDPVIDAVCQLRAALRRDELLSSDRRWRQAMRLLQASAWLDGRTEAELKDLAILVHVLWQSPEQRSKVRGQVLELVDPGAKEALDMLDDVDAFAAQLDAMRGKAKEELSKWGIEEASPKLKRAIKRLAQLRREADSARRPLDNIDTVLERARAVHGRVMVEALELDASVLPASI